MGKNSIMVLAMIKKSQIPVRIILPYYPVLCIKGTDLVWHTWSCCILHVHVYVIEVHSYDYSIAPYAQHCDICSAHNNVVQYTEGLYAILLHIFYDYSVFSPPGLSLDIKKSTYKKVQRFIAFINIMDSSTMFPVVNLHCTVS